MNTNERLLVMQSRNHWKQLVGNELLWVKEYNALYGACSKNACTKTKSILASLRSGTGSFEGNPHFRRNTGLLGPYDLSPDDRQNVLFEPGTYRFAFVRDPYARLVSCFRNRVDRLGLEPFDNEAGLKNAHLQRRRNILAWKTGLQPDSVDTNQPITFRDFVEFVCDEDPYDMDRHWYHQCRTIHHDFIAYDFIGRVETYNADLAKILAAIGAPPDFDWEGSKVNASGSAASLDSYFDVDTAALFAQTFEEDFDTFEYPTEIPALKVSKGARPVAPPERAGFEEPDRNRALREVGIVIPTIMRFESLRRLVLSIRTHCGSEIAVHVGVQGAEERYLREFGERYRLNLHFLPADCGVSATRNFLIRQVEQPYILFCDDDFAFHELTNIESAWSLLQARPDISIVGGLLDDVSETDTGRVNGQSWLNYANFISYDKAHKRVTFLPCEYVQCDAYLWGNGSFYFCDTVLNFFLARTSLFDDESLCWDEAIKFRGEREDFFMTLFERGRKDIVFYSGLVAEHHDTQNPAYRSLSGRNDWACHWMAKRGIEQALVFGKWSDLRDPETGEFARIPFHYLDANENPVLSEDLNIPYRQTKYMHVRMPRSFASGEAQIFALGKALRAARQSLNAAEGKLKSRDARLRAVEQRLRAVRSKSDGNLSDDVRSRFETEYAAALTLYGSEEYTAAAQRFLAAWDHNKSSAKALRAAAESHVRAGELQQAEEILIRVCEMRPELPGPRNRLAEIKTAKQHGVLSKDSQHEFDPGGASPITT